MYTLGQIGDKRAVEPLIEALKDEDWLVRECAAEALEEMNWQPKDDIEMVYYSIAKQDWDELAEVGEPAVRSY